MSLDDLIRVLMGIHETLEEMLIVMSGGEEE